MRIYATLTDPTSGDTRTINLRDYVVNPKYGEDYSTSMLLISPEAQVVPSDWVFNQSTTVDALANHPHFRRSGRKREDHREYVFSDRDRAIKMVEHWKDRIDRCNHVARGKEQLEEYTVEYNRVNLFKDFKSEE